MQVSDRLRAKAERERKRTKIREPKQQMPKLDRAEVLRRRHPGRIINRDGASPLIPEEVT
jgi:hypothetical protein